MKGWLERLHLAVWVAAFFIMGIIGYLTSEVGYRRQAVRLGHAEYYLDAENNRQWQWRTNCVQGADHP